MNFPNLGDSLAAAHPSAETLGLLRLRRSTPADHLQGPGPDQETLAEMLRIAARVPDHRRVCPFRFIVFEGEARARFGEVLQKAYLDNNPDAESERIAIERNRFLRAPVVIAVISSVDKDHRTPAWEQILCVGAVCQNLLLAASAYGFAAQWLTEWYTYEQQVCEALTLKDAEKVAGFVYIGTARELPKERGRPDMTAITSYY